MPVIKCEEPGCTYATSDVGDATGAVLLASHLARAHPVAPFSNNNSKAEKAKRPEIASEMTDEDWAYFEARWKDYKKATGIVGGDIITQLLECCCEQLRRDHHRNYSQAAGDQAEAPTEERLLKEVKQLAVRKKNKAVNRVALGTLKQDKGEPVRKFAGRIRSLATVSEYVVNCKTCKTDIPYTESVIMDQLIKGLANNEIQRDVLSHIESDKMTLETLLTFVEGKESGQASQGLMTAGYNTSGAPSYPSKSCGFCGDNHPRGIKFCKAAKHKCGCGRVGHFEKMCRNKGNPKKEDDAKKEQKTSSAEQAQAEASAAYGYMDGNWACHVEFGPEPTNCTSNKKVGLPKSRPSYPAQVAGEAKAKNKDEHFYSDLFDSRETAEKMGLKRKKIAGYPPRGIKKKWAIKKFKKAGSASHCNINAVVTALSIIMTGTAIMSTAVKGNVSATQSVFVAQAGSMASLEHHVFVKNVGWVLQGAKKRPMAVVEAEVDISAYLTLRVPVPNIQVRPASGPCLADTGASICLAGTGFMRSLGLDEKNLAKCSMFVTGANNARIKVLGAMLIEFRSRSSKNTSKQVVYVCDGVVGALLSLEACIDLGLVHEKFPHATVDQHSVSAAGKKAGCDCKCPDRADAPDVPAKLPFNPVPENVKKLEAWIMEYYAASAFNCCECQPLPKMHGEPLKIHMQEGVRPVASHSPIPVPLNWQAKVKAGLDRDEAIGVIEKVPSGTPTTWCHRMVVVPKKDNTPRRTVNFQPLNRYSSRQTHHTMSPFHQASMVPAGTKKTVLDAWNGYHSVYLDPKCRDLTTFITPWGRYRYRTTPQGYLAAGDAYTERFDRIITDIPNKTKCVDDTIMWSNSIEECFLDTCTFLTLCSRNGIVFNQKKFAFCKDVVEFAGFIIGTDSVKPAPKIMEGIMNFPVPKNISDVRGWFGLVNQVAPFFASRPVMQPFRELLKPAAKGKQIYWDENLTKLFEESKVVIVKAIEDGIKSFKLDQWTCLMPDFSKTGIGYLLMQKRCTCEKINPYCCPGGWQVVLAGSRFTKDAETRFAPVEGEALAVQWALESTRHYTLGNPKLLVATDHKPLLKILGDRKLEDIANPRLMRLKEKTLRWHFDIIHVPGKTHVGPDTLSRKQIMVALVNVLAVDNEDSSEVEEMESIIESMVAANMPHPVTWQQVRDAVASDKIMAMLLDQITEGFPPEKAFLRLELREFFQHRDHLSQVDGVPLYKERVIVPVSLRVAVLETLHSAHQGVTGMTLRAQSGVWWPGITPQIKEIRDKCKICTEYAPSQPSAPPQPLPQPDYPFQQIVTDYFQSSGHHYLVIADRFSGWPTVQFCGGSTGSTTKLLACLREYFSLHGIPEEMSSDGGSTYMAYETQKFLSDYRVKHRVSSVAFPHSNQRAELAVKSMKRLIRDNTSPDGGLNNDRFMRAVMTYRNTPDRDTGRSPAQVIFGNNLRDFLPAPLRRHQPRSGWKLLREDRERALRKRALKNMERLSVGTKQLQELRVHDTVQVQNQVGNYPSRWDITGTVVEVLPHDQYVVKVHGSGRLTTRNRKFLKKIFPYGSEPMRNPTLPLNPDKSGGHEIHPRNDVSQETSDEVPSIREPAIPGIPVPEPAEIPVPEPAAAFPVPEQLRRSGRERRGPDTLNISRDMQGSKSYIR